jgi:hypothetical protein
MSGERTISEVAQLFDVGAAFVNKMLSLHCITSARGFGGAAHRSLRLPPYSPDFSPIEQRWSKIKTILQAVKARTCEELEKVLAQAIKLVAAADIRDWFKHCGYSIARK